MDMFRSVQNQGKEEHMAVLAAGTGRLRWGVTTLHYFINLPDIKIINKQVPLATLAVHGGIQVELTLGKTKTSVTVSRVVFM
ncbi:hypothetical protein E2C01_044491 [Portunus trituberculatus]|uniref:Uncharacterized protein n=1 Tax=Portunus trituberculatus TaxID=210409 RepID=A0A5B7FVS3_PORTR|nr:hypothetical protein [Portunus trituberculatus]